MTEEERKRMIEELIRELKGLTDEEFMLLMDKEAFLHDSVRH